MNSIEIAHFCSIHKIIPKSITMPSPTRPCSKIVILTNDNDKHTLYPAIKRWTHCKQHHLKPFFKEIIKCTDKIDTGLVEPQIVPIKNVNFIINEFLLIQGINSCYGELNEVYKNSESCIRIKCLIKNQNSYIEQILIDNTNIRIYNVLTN